MTPTKEDHRVAIQCMNARYAEEAAEIVAMYREKQEYWAFLWTANRLGHELTNLSNPTVSLKDAGKLFSDFDLARQNHAALSSRASGVEDPNAEQVRNPDKLA